jgi:CO dehydrogenase maturation factor
MKIAVAGKGGVGKTTLSALLAREFDSAGYSVIAVDGDPAGGLGLALGFPGEGEIVPLIEMKKLIDERMGTKGGAVAGYFKLNPHVADVPDTYGKIQGRIRLMVMGTVSGAGAGCMCPENAFVREVLDHILTERNEVVILDLEAGYEHLGRGTARGVDVLLVVLGSSRQSFETAKRIRSLASELQIEEVWAVVNGVDVEAPKVEEMKDWPPRVTIPWSPTLRKQAAKGEPAQAVEPEVARAISELREILEKTVAPNE